MILTFFLGSCGTIEDESPIIPSRSSSSRDPGSSSSGYQAKGACQVHGESGFTICTMSMSIAGLTREDCQHLSDLSDIGSRYEWISECADGYALRCSVHGTFVDAYIYIYSNLTNITCDSLGFSEQS